MCCSDWAAPFLQCWESAVVQRTVPADLTHFVQKAELWSSSFGLPPFYFATGFGPDW